MSDDIDDLIATDPTEKHTPFSLKSTLKSHALPYVPILIELIGLSLAFIEVKLPVTARRIEKWLDGYSRLDWNRLSEIAEEVTTKKGPLPFVSFLVTCGTGISVYDDQDSWVWGLVACFVAMAIWLFLWTLVLFGLSRFIRLLDRVSNQHALGGFGVLLAVTGAIIEFVGL